MKLFIDDMRSPPDHGWNIARSSEEAISYVKKYGVPNVISFDHDLGGEDASIIFVNFLINSVLEKEITFPHSFTFYVHSANPIGAENIKGKLSSFLNYLKERNENA